MTRPILTDQNFNDHIVSAIRRLDPLLECYSVRDFALDRASDADIIAFAADRGFVLLSHDVRTIPPAWYERLGAGLDMPFVFLIPELHAVGQAARETTAALAAAAGHDHEPELIRRPLR